MKSLSHVLRVWLIVYVRITTIIYSLDHWLNDLPTLVKTAILSGMMVFALQYALLPLLNKWEDEDTGDN